ncbi:nuclear transport factor 2 family protein [Flavisphingomonas formosensis]|uniref:nuclear transport factor 2 family protein n=1 Tax=Flavisphingomonas formosensis TaxID=861534 RepID=UPI0012F7A134|nr:nuclear transport factor 2 family protein [Sphingomonas formosensis]
MTNEALMRSYYEAYNSEDESRLAPLLAEDVVLVSAAGEQAGRDAYLATYRYMIATFVDRMTPERIVESGDGAVVDIHDRLVARADVADFLGMALNAGQAVELALTGRYRIEDGRIRHIEIAPRG